jgi:hypothetical protein
VASGYLRKETEWKHTNFSGLHFRSALPQNKWRKYLKCEGEPRFQRCGGELIIDRTIPHKVIHFKLQWWFTVSVYLEVPAQCEHGLCCCYFWGTCYFPPMGVPVCIADIFSTYSIAILHTQQEYSSTMSITHFHQVQNKTLPYSFLVMKHITINKFND